MARAKQIRVVNEIGLGENGEDAAPYKVTLIPESGADDAGRGPLVLPYNPEEYELRFGSSWEARNAASVASDLNASDWQYGEADSLSMSMTLQPQDPDQNDIILSTLRIWTVVPSSNVQRPPTIRVQQGTGKRSHPFTGHIEQVTARAMDTDALGRILTMSLEIRFIRNPIWIL